MATKKDTVPVRRKLIKRCRYPESLAAKDPPADHEEVQELPPPPLEAPPQLMAEEQQPLDTAEQPLDN